jgi:hypothetical protein
MRLTRRKIMSKKQMSGVAVSGTASERQSRHFEAEGIIPAWALGEKGTRRTLSDRERRLTAAIYAQIPGVLEHVRKVGHLPRTMPGGGRDIGLRVLVQRRGIDIELSEAEQIVFDAIGAEGDVPGGCAMLIG